MTNANTRRPHIFGIRHLSPAGAFYLRTYLEEKRPRLVLIEGPSDLGDVLEPITRPETKPPIAILAYTKETPVETILYPFAEYSPEYQAILWCRERGAACRFMDLPSEVFLGIARQRLGREEGPASERGEEERLNVYALLDEQAGEDGHETFWERTLEQTNRAQSYHQGANLFGESLRELSAGQEEDWPEILVREAYMRRQIRSALAEGFDPGEIVVVTGAYHVQGLLDPQAPPMSDREFALLPRAQASHTLMPYSDYRLSTRSGYGAGNKAPAYYQLIWEGLRRGEPSYAASAYLTRMAAFQRQQGMGVSSAEVIEALRLAGSLAKLRGGVQPALRDLRDAAVTCMGGGNPASLALARADVEIGTRIGALPQGVSRTSIQEDFYRQLGEWKLEKYRDIAAQDLALDLRENRNVSSRKAAFLDLYRSFFLHQLRVLGICFASLQQVSQDNATWAEHWVLRWSPEAEIQLVESALKGDTVAQAASFLLKEQAESAGSISGVAQVIEDAFTCGMEAALHYATGALQAMAVDAASLEELAQTASRLSAVIRYGSIRNLEAAPLTPILQQLFLRACLILPGACVCDEAASQGIAEAMEKLNRVQLAHEFLEQELWLGALEETARRDDLNTRLSGFAAAILLERGAMDEESLRLQVLRRLSRGVPAQLGAGWFEGLAGKNRYALIARLSLWEQLDAYLASLDGEEFKRALVFLRRAFADFSSLEKDEIAENLGELWGLNGQQVSEQLNASLKGEEQKLVESLGDFDFDL